MAGSLIFPAYTFFLFIYLCVSLRKVIHEIKLNQYFVWVGISIGIGIGISIGIGIRSYGGKEVVVLDQVALVVDPMESFVIQEEMKPNPWIVDQM